MTRVGRQQFRPSLRARRAKQSLDDPGKRKNCLALIAAQPLPARKCFQRVVRRASATRGTAYGNNVATNSDECCKRPSKKSKNRPGRGAENGYERRFACLGFIASPVSRHGQEVQWPRPAGVSWFLAVWQSQSKQCTVVGRTVREM